MSFVGSRTRDHDCGSGTVEGRSSGSFVSRECFNEQNDPRAQHNPYSIFNGRIAYRDPSGRYELGVYTQNIGDVRYRNNFLITEGGTRSASSVNAPRTFGVDGSVKF